jgi:uncharacterized membrane protein
MALKSLRFISVVCTALVLGLTVTHVLEIPGKRQLSSGEWLLVQHTFYGGFAIVGGISEILGLATTIAILFGTWKNRKTFFLTLMSTLCFLGMFLSYWLGNRPINSRIADWTPATLPTDWAAYRNHWDYAHGASACFAAIALAVLLISILRDEH